MRPPLDGRAALLLVDFQEGLDSPTLRAMKATDVKLVMLYTMAGPGRWMRGLMRRRGT
jgi:hypothetical protein